MVYYFSGTGNSGFVATTLANFLGETLQFLPDVETSLLSQPDELFVLVFPVYSWGVPPLISNFIEQLPEEFVERMKEKGTSLHCVMTCGDEVAMAPEMIVRNLTKRGLGLTSIWSVIMPNNYVLLPGFDVDSKQVEDTKLKESEKRIIEIAEGIRRGDKRIDVTRGSWPRLKSGLIFPLFKRWGIFPKKWHYEASCISCGKCARICPLLNVKMVEGHPKWGINCCSCLGCYHVCPVHAVAYGKETRKKGQYLFPLPKIVMRKS